MRLDDALLAAPARVKERDFASLLLITIAVMTVAFLAWAALARVETMVVGQGRVIPASRLQLVSNLEGGTVSAILVRAGDRVKRGQLLVRLDPVARSAELAASDTSLDALEARAARLAAEAKGGAPIAAPGVDAALMANERALAAATRAAFQAEREMAAARLVQAERAAAAAEADVRARAEALALARREVEVTRPLVDKGVEPQMALVRAESAVVQASAALSAAEAAARRADAARREAASGVGAVAERFRREASEALAQTRAEIAARRQGLPALADRVARTELRAPVDGVVGRVLVTTIGGSVAPGAPLVEVVPAGDSLVVEATVQPADIGFVRAGQAARVKISAYDFSLYGTLEGVVESVAPDAVVDERSGQPLFMIRVRTRANALKGEGGARLPISAGMTAEVDVLGQDRSILSYLLTPVSRLGAEAFREK